MAEEGIAVGGEEKGSSLNPQKAATALEERARSKGWRPLDEFKGDAADWVDAKEFVGREKLFEKIHDLKNQISRQASRFEAEMTKVAGHFAKVQETEYKKAMADLKRQLANAKEAEDVEAVAQIAGEIKEVEQAQKEVKKEQSQARSGEPSPEFVAWKEENKEWFNVDAEMTADAISFGSGYAMANPDKSQKEVLDHVIKRIKRLYPEKFEDEQTEETTGTRKVSRVESGTTRQVSSKKKGQLTVGDLDEMEVSVMRTLIKRGALKEVAKKNNRTEQEEYLAQLAERKAAD